MELGIAGQSGCYPKEALQEKSTAKAGQEKAIHPSSSLSLGLFSGAGRRVFGLWMIVAVCLSKLSVTQAQKVTVSIPVGPSMGGIPPCDTAERQQELAAKWEKQMADWRNKRQGGEKEQDEELRTGWRKTYIEREGRIMRVVHNCDSPPCDKTVGVY
jgi:hypothetical protein